MLFYAIPLVMGMMKNIKKKSEESSVSERRHKEAKDYTRGLVEELLSSTDETDASGRGG